MPLSIAEINIKNHIIKYPTLFQSRLDVLRFVLISDPESSWAADGTVKSINISTDDVPNAQLDLSELTSSPLNALKIKTPQSISNAIELAKLSIIQDNLDYIVQTEMPYETAITKHDLISLNQYSLLFNLPDNIEASWLKAARSLVHSLIVAIRQEYCHNMDNCSDVNSWQAKFAFDNYNQLCAIQRKYMPPLAPGVAERLKNLATLLKS